jgi:hypothetical protein
MGTPMYQTNKSKSNNAYSQIPTFARGMFTDAASTGQNLLGQYKAGSGSLTGSANARMSEILSDGYTDPANDPYFNKMADMVGRRTQDWLGQNSALAAGNANRAGMLFSTSAQKQRANLEGQAAQNYSDALLNRAMQERGTRMATQANAIPMAAQLEGVPLQNALAIASLLRGSEGTGNESGNSSGWGYSRS